MDALTQALLDIKTEVAERYRRRLQFVSARCDVEDLYQAVCFNAWRSRDQCRAKTPIEYRNWLRVICANAYPNLLTHHTYPTRDVGRESGPAFDYAEQRPDESAMIDVAEEIEVLLSKLPEQQRDAIRLRKLNELDYPAIRRVMRIGKGRCCSCIKSGIDRLRELVAEC